jgi:hypothetical protein
MYGPLQNGGSAYNPNPFNWNHAAHPKPRPAAETKSSARGPRGHASPRASRRIGCGPNRAVSHTAHCPSRPGGAGDGRWHRILRHTAQHGSAGPIVTSRPSDSKHRRCFFLDQALLTASSQLTHTQRRAHRIRSSSI